MTNLDGRNDNGMSVNSKSKFWNRRTIFMIIGYVLIFHGLLSLVEVSFIDQVNIMQQISKYVISIYYVLGIIVGILLVK